MAEVSKTARASMVAKSFQDKNYLTHRVCPICNERISLGTMYAVRVVGTILYACIRLLISVRV